MIWRNYYGRPILPGNAFWRDMRRLQREMDFLLGGTRGPARKKFPAINAWVNDEGLKATAEIPGVEPADINITVVGDTLTLSGTRNIDEMPEGAEYHRRERGYGEFTRSLQLPFQVDADSVEAHFSNGILEIVLPRLPEEKPKKITVKAG